MKCSVCNDRRAKTIFTCKKCNSKFCKNCGNKNEKICIICKK